MENRCEYSQEPSKKKTISDVEHKKNSEPKPLFGPKEQERNSEEINNGQ